VKYGPPPVWAAAALLACLCLPLGAAGPDRQGLEALRQRLEKLRSDITASEEARAEARDQLRASEHAISEANRLLHGLGARRQATRGELRALESQAQAGEAELAARRDIVRQLLVQRYVHGEHDSLKLLLAGQDPNETARQLHYYSYVSRAHTAQIDALQQSLERLQNLQAQAREKNVELAAIEAEQKSNRAELLRRQAERRTVFTQVSARLRDQRKQAGTLQRDEARLARLVEELGKVIASHPAPPRKNTVEPQANSAETTFSSLKGRLRLPVRGELSNRFGAPRSGGGPPWKGLFIRSPAGQEVRAVAAGRVVFADWMRGFGNLLVLDHGEGFLTIYGNGEAVLKQTGDSVRAGDVVATVGNTGGNEFSGLYFEIRHRGEAFDPLRWISFR
jgi:septal ring factor EnvC (AmiA/AmiB activator)